MDTEYLQNVVSSPYIDEGLGDRLAARGAYGAKRLSAMAGGSIYGPLYVKTEVLFNKFIKRITPILKEFAEGNDSVSVKLKQMSPKPTARETFTIQRIIDLYNFVNPTFLQSQILKGIQSETKTNLSFILKENVFTRKLSLGSGNTSKILGAYVTDLKMAYDEFLRDVSRVTNTSVDQVKKVVGGLNKNWGPVLNKIKSIPGIIPSQLSTSPQQTPTQPVQGITTISQPTLQSSPQGNAATNSPVIQGGLPSPPVTNTTQAQNNTPVQSSIQNTPQAQTNASGNIQLPQEKEFELVSIIDRVIDIIIESVKVDSERAASFLSDNPELQKDLPKNWTDEPLTKEDINEEDDPETINKPEEPDEPERKNEFIYNFWSKYDKHRTFAIEVDPPDPKLKSIQFSNGSIKKINVIWHNSSHKNDIYVSSEDDKTKENIKRLIFRFFDHDVNPRMKESTTFSIESLLFKAHPLIKLSNEFVSKLNSITGNKTELFQRALYAVTVRKSMEFKRRNIPLAIKDDGEVYQITKDGDRLVTKAQIMAYTNSPNKKERERWLQSLDKIGYFALYPKLKPQQGAKEIESKIHEIPAAMNSVKALNALGYKMTEAMERVNAVINKIGINATEEEYTKEALKTPDNNKKPENISNPDSSVTAPISSKDPKPDVAPSKPSEHEYGSVSWDEVGNVTWQKPDGKSVKFHRNNLKSIQSPRLKALLQLKGYYDKFPALDSKPDKVEELINPFQLDNFL